MSGCYFQTKSEAEHFYLYLVIQVKPATISWRLNATFELMLQKKFCVSVTKLSQNKVPCINAAVIFCGLFCT